MSELYLLSGGAREQLTGGQCCLINTIELCWVSIINVVSDQCQLSPDLVVYRTAHDTW